MDFEKMAFPETGDHVMTSYLTSKDVESVTRETLERKNLDINSSCCLLIDMYFLFIGNIFPVNGIIIIKLIF